MKKKIVVILLAAAITAGAAGIAGAKYKSYSTAKARETEFSSVLSGVNKSRTAIRNNPASLKSTDINWFSDDKTAFSENEVNELVKYAISHKYDSYSFIPNGRVDYDDNKYITKDAAVYDINELFKLFKYCYGPYGYYGGDKTFKEIQSRLITEINKVQQIKVSDFRNIIIKNLKFITDGHFDILASNIKAYNTDIFQHSFYNYSANDYFYKDKEGWYKLNGKDKLYVKEIDNNTNIQNCMYHSINDNGQLVYKLSLLKGSMDQTGITVGIKYVCNGKVLSQNIKLEKLQPLTPDNTSTFKYYNKDGIPVSKITSFIESTQNDSDASAFSDSGKKMKNSPVSIIDLRGNHGGVLYAQYKWIQNYVGKFNPNYYSFNREGSMMLADSVQDKLYKELKYSGYTTPQTPFVSSPGKKATTIKNNKLLIVLVDKYTGSASEHFITELSSMDNVLIVGTNTAGCYLSGSPTLYGLHNSQIPIQIPSALYISPLNSDYEGKGMKPDILVDSKDALDKVVKMVQYYNLKNRSSF